MKKLVLVLLLSLHFSAVLAQDEVKPYREITVSQDGTADFTSIQEAVNATRDLGPGFVLIRIKKGTYHEKLVIPSWKTKIILKGEDRGETIIVNDDFSGKMNPVTGKEFSTFNSYTLLVKGNDFMAEDLTVKNASCGEGQAVALHVEGDRAVFRNCNILGCQDTIYLATEGSRQYYEGCYIEGTTDFIFGEATAVFNHCTVKSLRNSYVTAAATPPGRDFGFVFTECKLIADKDVTKVYLGRPWRPHAKTVFIKSELGSHIVAEGWNPWKGDKMFPEKEKTAFYAEYENTGKGADTSRRVSWSHQLRTADAEKYTLKNILGTDRNGQLWYKRNLR
ncbi:pectinesterase family protein [Sinomicrobium kalidii]|uniref:pectinesterase family protein n=1 Tax=Sinomicrobium kalidii TaxID=2900738 RepID=UPI001E63D95A|nr:pectinesterase family protein [Sinomicrobium kalidii]UGU14409.1 pectinesterase family protein [Sinomicrobium kalidii]